MTESEKIYDNFYELETTDYLGIINFYAKNALFLDNKSEFKDKDDFIEYIIILSNYVISLEKTGKYSKALLYADKTIELIESKLNNYDINLNEFTFYWGMMTSKGRALYNLKDYTNSINVFKKLLLWDPENDNNRIWLETSRSERRNSINKYLYIFSLFFFLLSFLVNSRDIGIPLLILGFICVSTGTVNEYLGDKIIKWLYK